MTYRQIAVRAARLAADRINSKVGHIQRITAKGGNRSDLVTEVDVAAEKVIMKTISRGFPTHGFFNEESGTIKGSSEYVWVIDPIDGTTNFTREIPCFSVSIALVKKKTVVLGVVLNPVTQELYVAEQGKGAYCNGKRIHVSQTKKLEDAFVCCEWRSRSSEFHKRGVVIFNRMANRVHKIRYLSGTVWNCSRVARGIFDVETCDTSFLDIAAVSLIVQEAGGKITNLDGRELLPFDTGNHRIIAANLALHAQTLSLLRGVGK